MKILYKSKFEIEVISLVTQYNQIQAKTILWNLKPAISAYTIRSCILEYDQGYLICN